jgi:uncharacterized protein YdiU (UPF0061 family)
MTTHFDFRNTYSGLPQRFYERISPTPVRAPRLIQINRRLAEELRLDPDGLASAEGVEVLAGNRVPAGAEPLAMAYAGHQFGQFVPQLGDGRAILLGEVVDVYGRRREIQWKGSGPTRFSRRGDGRAALGPVLREYIVSEAMAALGIPTTRALAAVATGEVVVREELLPGAVLTRVASSFIRVGTFQYFAARGDIEALRVLADHVIARHYQEAADSDNRYRTLLEQIVKRQASLIAQWMLVGFVHGVMNTDNMSIAGETIDYGPCAFADVYDPAAVFSSIDRQGRYAYANQPWAAHWNLIRLAEAMLPILAEDEGKAVNEAQQALEGFAPELEAVLNRGMGKKLGLVSEHQDDVALVRDFLNIMAAQKADYTLTFRRLSDTGGDPSSSGAIRALFLDPSEFDRWATRWHQRLDREPLDAEARRGAMRRLNPAYIPRNHRIATLIEAAVERNDFTPFEEFLDVMSQPFEDRPGYARYEDPPLADQRVTTTFCGT